MEKKNGKENDKKKNNNMRIVCPCGDVPSIILEVILIFLFSLLAEVHRSWKVIRAAHFPFVSIQGQAELQVKL